MAQPYEVACQAERQVQESPTHRRMALPFSERRLLLLSLDTLAQGATLLLTMAWRPGYDLDWRIGSPITPLIRAAGRGVVPFGMHL